MTLESGGSTLVYPLFERFHSTHCVPSPHLLCDLSNMFKILDNDLWFSLKHKLRLPRKGNEKSPLFFYLKKSSFLRIPTGIPLNMLISPLYFPPPTILSPTGVAPISCLLFFNEPLTSVSAAPMCTVTGLLGGSWKTHKWLQPPKEWFSLPQQPSIARSLSVKVRLGDHLSYLGQSFGWIDRVQVLWRHPQRLWVYKYSSLILSRRQNSVALFRIFWLSYSICLLFGEDIFAPDMPLHAIGITISLPSNHLHFPYLECF